MFESFNPIHHILFVIPKDEQKSSRIITCYCVNLLDFMELLLNSTEIALINEVIVEHLYTKIGYEW
jgi:hypothetical protein